MIKRFKRENRGECEREWRALTLLAAHAPGLAPVPHSADLEAEHPVVVMSRLPGEPLRGKVLSDQQLRALVAAVSELYAAVPADVLAEVPVRPGRQHQLIAQIRAWVPQVRSRVDGEVGVAMDRGLEWLARSDMERVGRPDVPRVFGPGDGNLANYLWDGTRVRVVDFEDSGLSDRPFELAEITEHVAAWVGPPLAAETFLSLFDLNTAERARLSECRKLLGSYGCSSCPSETRSHPVTHRERPSGKPPDCTTFLPEVIHRAGFRARTDHELVAFITRER
ncbi:phosphotransferase family protein [Streptomyces sp. NBC_01237]|uniref:phosphotransferase family protein n=1 Tax=Streptomyces sp. NBC_01237 TaxID=2903790 RepID=UPI002DDC14C2|nr:aminoglycoside phosphotransferase family protein [Streptomyces sp. NBC_01237]WRZ78552.1 aminoglycoside phosphotransferase family protein [Streptomyces sp. NBC_01237]